MHAMLEAFGQVLELGVVEECAGAGVLDDVLDFRHREAEVDRQKDGAELGDGENQLQLRMAVLQQRTDSVAGAHAAVAQGVGQAIAAVVEFAIGETQVAVDDRQAVTRNRRALGSPVAQPLIHNNLFYIVE